MVLPKGIMSNHCKRVRLLVSHSRSFLDRGKASEREGKNENKRDSLSTTKVVTTTMLLRALKTDASLGPLQGPS